MKMVNLAFRGIGRYRVAGIPGIRPVPFFITWIRVDIRSKFLEC
jgi:hypothetical protein